MLVGLLSFGLLRLSGTTGGRVSGSDSWSELSPSSGAQVVFPQGQPHPLIIRRSMATSPARSRFLRQNAPGSLFVWSQRTGARLSDRHSMDTACFVSNGCSRALQA